MSIIILHVARTYSSHASRAVAKARNATSACLVEKLRDISCLFYYMDLFAAFTTHKLSDTTRTLDASRLHVNCEARDTSSEHKVNLDI
jgi:hypothetical protein